MKRAALPIVVIFVAAILLAISAAASTRNTPALKEVVAQVRQAVYGPDGAPANTGIELRGPASFFDMQANCMMQFDGDGRFHFEFTTEFVLRFGHDGEHTWERSPGGDVRRLQDGNASFQLLFNWFLTGHWLSADSGLTLTMNKKETRGDLIGVHVDAGHGVEGVVLIDRATWLPKSMQTTQFGRKMVAEVVWGKPLDGRLMLQRLVVIDGGKKKITWDIEQARALAEAPSYAQPVDAIRVVYDRTIDPKLRVMKASGGHLWVRPLVNGEDMGWFLFDTGADGTVLDERVARELDLPVFGHIDSTGIGGRKAAQLRKVETLQLGGVQVKDIPVVSRDLSPKDRAMGTDVAGILGVDLLSRGIIVYDESDVAIDFHVPDTYELPQHGTWIDMPIHNAKPAVHLEYEGHTGLFEIDTGAPGRLIIGPQATKRHDLLRGRQTRRTTAWGTGGGVAARSGMLNNVVWGGKRFENVPVMFITQDQGAGADVTSDGIVGANLIRRFILVFDIEGEQIAFLDRK